MWNDRKSACHLIPAQIERTIVAPVIERHEHHSALRKILTNGVLLGKSVSELREGDIDLGIECVRGAPLQVSRVEILKSGLDFLWVSVGAGQTRDRILASIGRCRRRTKVRIPAGVLGGIDIVTSLLAVVLLAVAFFGRVYPVIAWPLNVIPHAYLALVLISVVYFVALRAVASGRLSAIEAGLTQTEI